MAFMDALDKAKQEVGGAAGLARLLTASGQKITSQAITQWKKVPVARAFDVERLTGVSKHDLRPDVWPRGGGA